MTAVRAVYIQCDLCDAASDYDSTPSSTTVEQARAKAQRMGWRRDKLGRDVCSDHPKLKGARR